MSCISNSFITCGHNSKPPHEAAPGTTPRYPAQRLRLEGAYGAPGARPSSRHLSAPGTMALIYFDFMISLLAVCLTTWLSDVAACCLTIEVGCGGSPISGRRRRRGAGAAGSGACVSVFVLGALAVTAVGGVLRRVGMAGGGGCVSFSFCRLGGLGLCGPWLRVSAGFVS